MKRHLPLFLSARFNRSDFERASRRLYVPGAWVDWGKHNFYWIAFRCLMDRFHHEREKIADLIPVDEVVHFHMDETFDSKTVDRVWPEYMDHRPDHLRIRYAGIPVFENDKQNPPLQAADLWAWWVREWCDMGAPERILDHDFREFHVSPSGPRFLTLDISVAENDFLLMLEGMANLQVNGREIIVLPDGVAATDPKNFSTRHSRSIACHGEN